MTTKTIEVKLPDDIHALVKKMAEHGRRKGRGKPEPVTIGEMAADLISTGVFRRKAANKWAKEHAKPRKPKAAKKSSSKKPAKVVKLKTAAKKGKAKKSTPASSSAAAPAAASVLD